MDIKEMRGFLDSLTSHIVFDYNEKNCGIDPITSFHYNMWYGDDTLVTKNIDEVFSVRLFDGKNLEEIYPYITGVA